MHSKKKILVAGGAGFLGSHLCERLLQEGHSVVSLDTYYTGRKENIFPLLSNPRFSALEHDICKPFDLEADAIYNLACPASPPHYQADPIQTWKTNTFGAFHLLELARRLRCPIFQASTSEIYGDPLVHPQTEEYWGHVNPIGVRSCYDEGKRCAETLFFDYHRQYGVPVKVGRIFNTYGPRMHPDDGRVVSNFIVQALRKEPITIYGKGEQTRSFCYVDDLIEAIVRLMDTPPSFLGPLNLGNPAEYTVLELAEKILELTGSSSPLLYKPLPSDDPKKRKPSIEKAKKILQWEPRISLEEGLKRTIAYFAHGLGKSPSTSGSPASQEALHLSRSIQSAKK